MEYGNGDEVILNKIDSNPSSDDNQSDYVDEQDQKEELNDNQQAANKSITLQPGVVQERSFILAGMDQRINLVLDDQSVILNSETPKNLETALSNSQEIRRNSKSIIDSNYIQKNFMKRGALNTDHLAQLLEQNNQIAIDMSKQEQLLLDLMQQHFIDFNNENIQNLAIYVLRRKNKNILELQFIQKVILSLNIFREQKYLFEQKDVNSQQQLYQQFKIEFFPRRQVVFYFGSIFCLLPKQEKDSNFKSHYNMLKEVTAQKFHPSLMFKEKKDSDSSKSNSPMAKQQMKQEDNLSKSQRLCQGSPKNNQQHRGKSIFGSALKNKDSFDEEYDDETYIRQNFEQMFLAKIMKQGDSFGEIALITEDAKRTATIVTREDTYLMTISRENFNKVMNKYRDNLLKEKLQFIKSFSFLQQIPHTRLLQLILHEMKNQTYIKNNIIYVEKNPANKYYFIFKGEVEITIQQKKLQKIMSQLQGEGLSPLDSGNRNNGGNALNKRISLRILSQNSYFGDYEIFKGVELRETQAVCISSEAEIFTISKDKLLELLQFHNQVDKMNLEAKQRQNWIQDHLKIVSEILYQNQQQQIQLPIIKKQVKSHSLHQSSQTNFNDELHKHSTFNHEKKLSLNIFDKEFQAKPKKQLQIEKNQGSSILQKSVSASQLIHPISCNQSNIEKQMSKLTSPKNEISSFANISQNFGNENQISFEKNNDYQLLKRLSPINSPSKTKKSNQFYSIEHSLPKIFQKLNNEKLFPQQLKQYIVQKFNQNMSGNKQLSNAIDERLERSQYAEGSKLQSLQLSQILNSSQENQANTLLKNKSEIMLNRPKIIVKKQDLQNFENVNKQLQAKTIGSEAFFSNLFQKNMEKNITKYAEKQLKIKNLQTFKSGLLDGYINKYTSMDQMKHKSQLYDQIEISTKFQTKNQTNLINSQLQ